MPLSPEQRAANLARIAQSAVALERAQDIPAELCTAQCIVESGWLEKAPGNNPFGIKAVAGQASVDVTTTEFLTATQLARVRASGKTVLSVDPPGTDGKVRVRIVDQFAAYATLDAAFQAYGTLLSAGRNFAPRLARYRQTRDLERLLSDLTGKDGLPPYATAPDYDVKLLVLIRQANVQAALAEARRAGMPAAGQGS